MELERNGDSFLDPGAVFLQTLAMLVASSYLIFHIQSVTKPIHGPPQRKNSNVNKIKINKSLKLINFSILLSLFFLIPLPII